MRKALVIAAAAVAVTAGGATALASASHTGTDDTPRISTAVPQQLGTGTTTLRHGGLDDGPNHDLGDDHGGDRNPGSVIDGRNGSDDGPNHDLGDDRSATSVPQPHPTVSVPYYPSTSRHGGHDDGPGHDVGDDHGGHDGPGHDVGDDHGGDR
ncbi:hypothetical protein [Amycolatopsis taiwanensis]|uniref:hypothetical protein n=1 Tax=Amycolatopsis taiwanensis TaxID=342230 RepID=UPI00048174FB|nr:hypothetical protein [Amycolatopsis taiwanensis]